MRYDEIVDEDGDLTSRSLRGVFDDHSFHDLSMLDFSAYEEVDIEINLTGIRHLDMRQLLCGDWGDRRIRITSHNCIIDNLPCVIDYGKRLYVEIYVKVTTNIDLGVGVKGLKGRFLPC